ncbi:MAG: hypothetical protein Q4D55_02385 [Eubacteriales bacterium]|nr:hypothetical protein [Eubacteriales bacterium]
MKYCKVCGLPETYPGIQFDEEGTCNFCHFYQEHKDAIENKESRRLIFEEQVALAKAKAKETGAPYDCIVGFSGGKDSTYIIWQMKNTYGLRVLAVTFQNGFHTEYGRTNIDIALEKLNVDHLTVRMKEDEMRKVYSKCVSVLKNFCSVCFHYMHYYCHQLAGLYGIPLIVNGRTRGQILQSALQERGIEPFQISRNLRQFEYQMFGELVEKLAKRGTTDYLEDVEVTSLSYFAYHDVSEEETMAFLEKELGWIRPKDGVPHGDCWAHAMAENFSIVKRGYPVRTGELAVLVRGGQLTREEAEAMLLEDRERYSEVDPELSKRFYDRIRVKGKGAKKETSHAQ